MYGVMRLGMQFSQLVLSYLLRRKCLHVIQKFRGASQIAVSLGSHDPQRAQLEDVLREIAVHVIRPITRCVGTKQTNSAVCA